MTAKKRETGRNYIGLPHEETGASLSPTYRRPRSTVIIDHILGLMAAMVKRRSERGSYPAAAALNEGPGPMARSGSRSQKLRWARTWSRTVS